MLLLEAVFVGALFVCSQEGPRAHRPHSSPDGRPRLVDSAGPLCRSSVTFFILNSFACCMTRCHSAADGERLADVVDAWWKVGFVAPVLGSFSR